MKNEQPFKIGDLFLFKTTQKLALISDIITVSDINMDMVISNVITTSEMNMDIEEEANSVIVFKFPSKQFGAKSEKFSLYTSTARKLISEGKLIRC